MDERRVAHRADIDLIVGHAGSFGVQPEKFVLVDAPPIGERADEVVAEVLALPGRVGFDEYADTTNTRM